jgi:hypothetical protein
MSANLEMVKRELADADLTALVQVTNTMDHCKSWFETHQVPYDGGDVVQFAKLVLAREGEIADGINGRRRTASSLHDDGGFNFRRSGLE